MEIDEEPIESVEDSLKMVSGSFYIPKESRSRPQGEDAHFICEEEGTIGVADGVGGWTRKGVDAGEYARKLMINSVMALHHETKGAVDPQRVLTKAYSNTKLSGSSTACVISLTNNTLVAANVGDSGFMVIRNGNNIYRSPTQQRGFNCPYQLGLNPSTDSPRVAQRLLVAVEEGDVVVAGTDGLFDNMHQWEIVDLVAKCKNHGLEPQVVASTIAQSALYNSFDRFSDTPFAQASRAAGHDHRGAKVDDITVVVGYILPSAVVPKFTTVESSSVLVNVD